MVSRLPRSPGAATVTRMRALRPAALVVALLAGAAAVASAATVRGTQRPDRLVGTQNADAMFGLRGSDRLFGRGGADLLEPGAGRDFASGGAGNDRFAVEADAAPDVVSCGAGRDIVTAEPTDRVRRDCEVVSVQLSRDPYRNPDSEHETQVEPDSFAHGSTIVTVFQSGRFVDGGASNIGFATSHDGGRSWRAGFLPRLSRFSSPPGDARRVSDPVVAYDAVHGVWLAASLALAPEATELLVSRSPDGLSWGPPVTAARTVTDDLAYDKEWSACDNWPTRPVGGRCYLS